MFSKFLHESFFFSSFVSDCDIYILGSCVDIYSVWIKYCIRLFFFEGKWCMGILSTKSQPTNLSSWDNAIQLSGRGSIICLVSYAICIMTAKKSGCIFLHLVANLLRVIFRISSSLCLILMSINQESFIL